MASNIVSIPYEYFADPDRGRPLFNAQIFVGQPDLDPEIPANQKQVTARQEDGTEVNIPQPIRTNSGGYPVLNGSNVVLVVDGAYSIKVLDRNGDLKLESPNVTDGAPITAETITDFTDLVFTTVSEMVTGIPGITYESGMKLKVQGENDTFTNYIVTSTQSDVDLGNGLWAKELSSLSTVSEKTWYVDPVNGTDAPGRGSEVGNAFRTIQYAFDSLPNIVNHQQTIQLADGDYRESSVAPELQPRPAVLWGHGKITTFRSYLDGSNIAGPIVIKGNASDNTAVTITTTANYNFGIYNNDGQIALQDLTVQTSGADSGVLVVSHRNTSHIYCLNVIADSIFAARTTACISVESAGIIEWIDGKVRNGTLGLNTTTSGDNVTFSTRSETIFENNTRAILARNNAYVSLNSLQDGTGKVQIIDDTNPTAMQVINSAHVSVRGNDATTDMCQIEGIIDVDSASVELVFSETLGPVILQNGGSIKYNASNYQRGIASNGGDVWLATSNSYVSPETANTDVRPVTLTDGGRINYTGTNNIVGSTGEYVSYNPGALAYTADDQTASIVVGRDSYRVTADTGTRTGAKISVTDVEEGRVIFLYADTNAVEFTDGGTMDLGRDITLGQQASQYTGMTLMIEDGQWHLVGLGAVRT